MTRATSLDSVRVTMIVANSLLMCRGVGARIALGLVSSGAEPESSSVNYV